MKNRLFCCAMTLVLFAASPGAAMKTPGELPDSTVHAQFDLSAPEACPFPSDYFTVADPTHLTGLRVNLPKPDCSVRVSDCQDFAVINELDGFNLQPRISIPFDGAIDISTVRSDSVFLISLGDVSPGGDGAGKVIGINQVVWDPQGNTLYVQPDEFLEQHTRYAVIVTNRVHGADRTPVGASDQFRQFHADIHGDYKDALIEAMNAARHTRLRGEVVAATVFTTESATATMEKIRDQIKAQTPEPADFSLGPGGARTVFRIDAIAGITWNQQKHTTGSLAPTAIDMSLFQIYPGAIGQIAFGKYRSPDYQVHPGEFIPMTGTASGTPVMQGTNEIFFNVVLPSGATPRDGWPVAIFGHGGGCNRYYMLYVASALAKRGIASIAIDAAGHGFGPLGTLAVKNVSGETITFRAGGRGIDQNGDGAIDGTEGFIAAKPRLIIDRRDGLRQTVIDLMQLIRVIQVGMDVDGDGAPDLDSSRIYYAGHSHGGNYGAMLLALDPDVRAGVLNGAGGPLIDFQRLGIPQRPTVGVVLAARTPSLINPPGLDNIDGTTVPGPRFDENIPLRDQPAVINNVPGALAIQQWIDDMAWVSQSGSPVAYASHIRTQPLAGLNAKAVILQINKGDENVTNPAATGLLRAGELSDRATFYRHDLAFAERPVLPKNPHMMFMSFYTDNASFRAFRDITLGAQEQMAAFFASDGVDVIHPEPFRFFEVPLPLPLPETLSYIP